MAGLIPVILCYIQYMGDRINKEFENFQKDLEIRKKKLKLLIEFEPDKNLDDVLKELKELDISHMTPIDAMNKLYQLQNKLKNRW